MTGFGHTLIVNIDKTTLVTRRTKLPFYSFFIFTSDVLLVGDGMVKLLCIMGDGGKLATSSSPPVVQVAPHERGRLGGGGMASQRVARG